MPNNLEPCNSENKAVIFTPIPNFGIRSIDLSSTGLKASNTMLNIKLNLLNLGDRIEGSISNICGLEAPSVNCLNSPKHQNDVWLWQRSLSLLITEGVVFAIDRVRSQLSV